MLRRVITIGTFDTPHIGHANFIRQCREYGDEVTVAVNTDRFVFEYKGAYPVFNETERCSYMRLLADHVLLNDGPGRDVLLFKHDWLLAIGSDWADRNYLGQIGIDRKFLEDRGIALVYLPYTAGISTSEIKLRLSS